MQKKFQLIKRDVLRVVFTEKLHQTVDKYMKLLNTFNMPIS